MRVGSFEHLVVCLKIKPFLYSATARELKDAIGNGYGVADVAFRPIGLTLIIPLRNSTNVPLHRGSQYALCRQFIRESAYTV